VDKSVDAAGRGCLKARRGAFHDSLTRFWSRKKSLLLQ
jgi:hypothetical protein